VGSSLKREALRIVGADFYRLGALPIAKPTVKALREP